MILLSLIFNQLGLIHMLTIKLKQIYIKKVLAKSSTKISLLIFQRRINRVSGIFMRKA